MRIETTKPPSQPPNLGGWEDVYVVDDALGVADVNVLLDEIVHKEEVGVLPDGRRRCWVERRIVGEVAEELSHWADLHDGQPEISLPEEGKVYGAGQVAVRDDDGLLELVLAEIVAMQ